MGGDQGLLTTLAQGGGSSRFFTPVRVYTWLHCNGYYSTEFIGAHSGTVLATSRTYTLVWGLFTLSWIHCIQWCHRQRYIVSIYSVGQSVHDKVAYTPTRPLTRYIVSIYSVGYSVHVKAAYRPTRPLTR